MGVAFFFRSSMDSNLFLSLRFLTLLIFGDEKMFFFLRRSNDTVYACTKSFHVISFSIRWSSDTQRVRENILPANNSSIHFIGK